MYFLEFILKKLIKKTTISKEEEIIPDFQPTEDSAEECKEHTFLPVDSTGEVLACINCGLVVHKNDLHKSNPF